MYTYLKQNLDEQKLLTINKIIKIYSKVIINLNLVKENYVEILKILMETIRGYKKA